MGRCYDLSKRVGAMPKKRTRMRYVVCVLGLLSLVMVQMSRMIVNVSIVNMIDPSMINSQKSVISSGGSCPIPEADTLKGGTKHSASHVDHKQSDYITNEALFPHAEETEVNYHGISFQANTTLQSADLVPDPILDVPRFKWSIKKQNVLLGCFFYSYFVFMILGARLSEMYGAKYVILLGVGGSAFITLFTPWMASNNFYLLIVSRTVMGCIQSGVFPSIFTLINKWLSPSEASIFAPLTKMSLRLGMLFASMLPGIIPKWPNVFYITGTLMMAWSVLWLLIATSEPENNRWVCQAELEHIMKTKTRKLQHKDVSEEKSSKKTPWLGIMTSPPVIALIIAKVAFNTQTLFLTVEAPSYLKFVHHASREMISSITSGMFLIQVLVVLVIGWLAKAMVQRRTFGLEKTGVRIFFQTIANGGSGMFFIFLMFNGCNIIFVAIVLQIVSLLDMFTAGGETMLPFDLTEDYPATILAIGNSFSNLTAIGIPILTAFLLQDQGGDQDRWNILICLIGGVNMFAALLFGLIVKAEPLDFDKKRKTAADDLEATVSGKKV